MLDELPDLGDTDDPECRPRDALIAIADTDPLSGKVPLFCLGFVVAHMTNWVSSWCDHERSERPTSTTLILPRFAEVDIRKIPANSWRPLAAIALTLKMKAKSIGDAPTRAQDNSLADDGPGQGRFVGSRSSKMYDARHPLIAARKGKGHWRVSRLTLHEYRGVFSHDS